MSNHYTIRPTKHVFVVEVKEEGSASPTTKTFESHQSIEAVAYAKKYGAQIHVFKETVMVELLEVLDPTVDESDVIYVDSIESTIPTIDGELFDILSAPGEENK